MMKKMWLFVVVITTVVVFSACEKTPMEPRGGKGGVLGGEEKEYALVGEWYEANSVDNWGTIVTFTETTMSIIGYGVTSDSPIWKDTLIMYTNNLGYKITSNDTLEFEYRPTTSTEIPNYKVNYTFRSADTLFIEKVWNNSAASVYPPTLNDILLCRRIK